MGRAPERTRVVTCCIVHHVPSVYPVCVCMRQDRLSAVCSRVRVGCPLSPLGLAVWSLRVSCRRGEPSELRRRDELYVQWRWLLTDCFGKKKRLPKFGPTRAQLVVVKYIEIICRVGLGLVKQKPHRLPFRLDLRLCWRPGAAGASLSCVCVWRPLAGAKPQKATRTTTHLSSLATSNHGRARMAVAAHGRTCSSRRACMALAGRCANWSD